MANFPCKEQFDEFEHLAKRQHRIFPDAADIGIPIGEIEHLEHYRGWIRDMIHAFYPESATKNYFDYRASKWGTGHSVEFFIPVEIDEGMEAGYFFRLSKHVVGRRIPGGSFLTIEIEHRHRPLKK